MLKTTPKQELLRPLTQRQSYNWHKQRIGCIRYWVTQLLILLCYGGRVPGVKLSHAHESGNMEIFEAFIMTAAVKSLLMDFLTGCDFLDRTVNDAID